MKRTLYIIFLLWYGTSSAQPLECDGSFYLSLANNGPSVFYRVQIDPLTNDVLFDPLGGDAGLTINAIGYRPTDNYIYGIQVGSTNLCQVDATGTATVITNLTGLNPNYGYYGGEVSPDGQFLFLLGAGGNPFFTREIAKVNLDDYSVTTIDIPNADVVGVLSTDFAFDPTDGSLYGFDHFDNRLIKFDEFTGEVDETSYPITTESDAMGALFFDAFGNLFGYGDLINTGVANTLFSIDKTTGIVSSEATGPIAREKDGCACPYTVDLVKIVSPQVAFPCTEVTYVFEIANASALDQTGIDFFDEMPIELTITEIVQNPFGGTVTSGVGTNILEIEDLTIPQGIDSIIIRAEVAPDAEGIYKNQAVLTGLPVRLGSETLSDDPSTLALDDSTALEIIPLFVDLENDTIGICEGDSILLNASTHGVTYRWHDGSTDSLFLITTEGLYWVEVMSGCETVYDTVYAVENAVSIGLGADMEIELGDSVLLLSTITGNPNLQWLDPLGNSLSCLNCPEPFARPFFDVEYTLSGVDEFGCSDEDMISIRVNKERKVYIANILRPT